MKKSSIYLMFLIGFIGISLFGSERLSEIAMTTSMNSVNNIDKTVDDILTDAKSQTNTETLKFYFPSYLNDKKFFDDAYQSIPKNNKFDDKLKAAILPHHLVFPQKIAAFFDRLSKTQNVETVFLIGPNHSNKGANAIHVSKYGYTTPYGNLELDSSKIKKLFDSKSVSVLFEKEVFDGEHSISALTPFIKKSLPGAKIVPITLKWHTSDLQINQLTKAISDIAGPNDIVIGSIDFSHYLPLDLARFHDETSRSVIENFDFDNFKNLEIDSFPTLKVVTQFTYEDGAQNVEIIDHSNSAEMSLETLNTLETTSHFYIAFKDGEIKDVERNFSILAVGDIMLGRFVRIISERNGNIEYPFELIRGKEDRFFNGFDLLFGNLEGPIYKEGVRSETSMIFGFNDDTAPMLAKFGFDVLSIANNHTLNQRNEGLDNTVKKLTENNIGACGHPVNIDETSVVYKDVNDKKIAFVCFEDAVTKLDKEKAVNVITTAKNNSDFVIVSPHFGVEYKHNANQRQIELAHAFVDAGADIIIGTHPHVVQNFEIYNGVPIFYSLGNFIFDQYWSYDTQEGLTLGLIVTDDYYRIYLFPILSAKSRPYLMNTEQRKSFFEKFIKWGNFDDFTSNMIRSGVIEIQR